MLEPQRRSDLGFVLRLYGTVTGGLAFVAVVATGQFWALALAGVGPLLGFLFGERAVSREDEESND